MRPWGYRVFIDAQDQREPYTMHRQRLTFAFSAGEIALPLLLVRGRPVVYIVCSNQFADSNNIGFDEANHSFS